MRIFLSFLLSFALLTLSSSCNNHKDSLPAYGSRNNYEYTFTITVTSGEASMLLIANTDGDEVLLNNREKSESLPAQFHIKINTGETKRYVLSTKGAKKYSVEARIEPSRVKGYWKFEEKVNGKLLKSDQYQFALSGEGERHSITYHSSSID